MNPECLPKTGMEVLGQLKHIVKTHRFVLAGGTATAIQIGHRMSEDLDFFTRQSFSTDGIFRELTHRKLAPSILQEDKDTLSVIIRNTKVSMFFYPYPFVEKQIAWQGISISGLVDIAAMKIIAICQRGAKRDFVDLFFILRTTPFWKISGNMIKRFGVERINPVHIGKALVYFHDAESDPEPRYCAGNETDWRIIKKFFVGQVQQMVLDLQGAKEAEETGLHN